MKKITIIGGGISGLAAAYKLVKNDKENYQITLVEAAPYLGGKMQTAKQQGFTIEGGPDCYLTQKPAAARLSKEVGMAGDIIGTSEENKGTYILSGGKLHVLPEGLMLMVPTKIIPFALSPLISWPGKLRMGMDLFLPRRKGGGDESLSSFVTRRLGSEALNKIAQPLIGGIHAGDPENMSLKASFSRFLDMEQKHRSLIKAMLAAKRNTPPKTGKDNSTYFMSFKHGMGQLPQAVAKQLDGVAIKLNTKVNRVITGQSGYLITTDAGEEWQADAVILAVPAYAAAEIIDGLDPQIAQTMRSINFVSSATVSIAFNKKDLGRSLLGFGFLVPAEENRDIMAVTYSSRKFKHRDPGEEYLLVRCFVGGPKKQEMVLLNDQEMLAKVKAELETILGITAKPIFTKVFRWEKGMPQYSMGHLERVDSIEQRLEKFPGLVVAGNSYHGIGVPDCIESGERAAAKVM